MVDGPAGGFVDAAETAANLAAAIEKITGLDRSRLLVFGGCSSASRDAGVCLQLIGERLSVDEFQGVDELRMQSDGALKESGRDLQRSTKKRLDGIQRGGSAR